MKIPLLSDFADGRATPHGSTSESWLGLLWVVIPGGLGTLVTTTSGLETLLRGHAAWLAIARLAIDVALAVGCGIVIAARRRVASTGFASKQAAREHEYRYPQRVRAFCKLAFLPLALLPVFELASLTPNRLLGRSFFKGYLCVAGSQTPVRMATIDLLNALDETSLVTREASDDTGFFVVDLKPWAPRPQKLVVVAGACSGAIASLSSPTRSGAGCPGAQLDVDRPTKEDQWEVACPTASN